jgi:2-C-methyl-D-erythritol 4-phosphate cytidylyltransferase
VVIAHTVEREQLWHALTPQVFPLGLLREALQRALVVGKSVTDEASAIEMLGLQPLLIAGRADNIKVTRPEDLALAELFLQGD